jgi:hypothetical protein
MLRGALIACVAALALPAAAGAHGGILIREASQALQRDPVFVHQAAIPSIAPTDAEDLRRLIRDAGGGIAVAVLPADALHEARTAEDVLGQVARQVGRPGTYVVVVGGQFRAASSAGTEQARVPALADAAFAEHGHEGLAPTLSGFVGAVAEARGRGDDDGYGAGAVGLGLLAAGAAGAVGVFAVRRRRQRFRELARVKEVAEEDLLALGSEIRELDLDVELPTADARAREDYGRALAAYERASTAFDRASRPEDLEPVSSALEEGRYDMVSARARLEGKEPPERRPPCFFDPRHGPSARDVEWAPPGGAPRPVPACAADAIRVEQGEEPDTRQVLVHGSPTPYWNAGPAFGPWAGGFFGGATGAFVPMLFAGSLLGDSWGDDRADDVQDEDLGDAGGGDFDGGDFGGGDFGGGDFGG